MKCRVVVNRSACIACGVAPSICPDVFELGQDIGRNRVVNKYSVETTRETSVGMVPEELCECVKQVAGICPVGAIKIET
ncbi:MAG: ferredoxin [Zestosphaera sp.]